MTYTEAQYNEVLQTTAAALQQLQAKLDASEKAAIDISKVVKQSAKLLKDGDVGGAKKKLDEAENPTKAARKTELLEKKARIEAEIAELGT
jgi:hypothetical protein